MLTSLRKYLWMILYIYLLLGESNILLYKLSGRTCMFFISSCVNSEDQ